MAEDEKSQNERSGEKNENNEIYPDEDAPCESQLRPQVLYEWHLDQPVGYSHQVVNPWG